MFVVTGARGGVGSADLLTDLCTDFVDNSCSVFGTSPHGLSVSFLEIFSKNTRNVRVPHFCKAGFDFLQISIKRGMGRRWLATRFSASSAAKPRLTCNTDT